MAAALALAGGNSAGTTTPPDDAATVAAARAFVDAFYSFDSEDAAPPLPAFGELVRVDYLEPTCRDNPIYEPLSPSDKSSPTSQLDITRCVVRRRYVDDETGMR